MKKIGEENATMEMMNLKREERKEVQERIGRKEK